MAGQYGRRVDYRGVSLWLDTCGDDLRPRPALDRDLDVDVAVVGAGYTGLWAAYYLAGADPSVRVAVVEQEIAGFGASGRNGGWCSALFAAGRAGGGGSPGRPGGGGRPAAGDDRDGGRGWDGLDSAFSDWLSAKVSAPMLAHAAQHRPAGNIRYEQRNLIDVTSDADGRFDLVFSGHALHHVPDLPGTLTQMSSLWIRTVAATASRGVQRSSAATTRGRLKSVSDSWAPECRSFSSTLASPAVVKARRTGGSKNSRAGSSYPATTSTRIIGGR